MYLSAKPPLDRMAVETTGLADPAPILFSDFSHPVLQHHYYVDRVISTVDVVNGNPHLNRNPESTGQVAAADVIVLTKTDVAQSGATGTLRARVHGLNLSARIVEAAFGEVDLEELLGSAGDLYRHGYPRVASGPVSVTSATGDGGAGQVSRTYSTSLTFDGPVDWAAFGMWLSMLLHARGEDVLRVKGLLGVGSPDPSCSPGVARRASA